MHKKNGNSPRSIEEIKNELLQLQQQLKTTSARIDVVVKEMTEALRRAMSKHN